MHDQITPHPNPHKCYCQGLGWIEQTRCEYHGKDAPALMAEPSAQYTHQLNQFKWAYRYYQNALVDLGYTGNVKQAVVNYLGREPETPEDWVDGLEELYTDYQKLHDKTTEDQD